MNKYIDERDPRTYLIIKSAMEVHRLLGPGYLEAVYQESLEMEFKLNKIPFIPKPKQFIFYKNQELKKYYIPDFIIYIGIIVEIKAEKLLTKIDEAQILNNLKVCGIRVGSLINFGELSLKFRRFVY